MLCYSTLAAQQMRDIWLRLRSERGNQLVEFAVSLPLLAVLVVGIFDFSSAFTVKQKLAAIALDGARGRRQPAHARSDQSQRIMHGSRYCLQPA